MKTNLISRRNFLAVAGVVDLHALVVRQLHIAVVESLHTAHVDTGTQQQT